MDLEFDQAARRLDRERAARLRDQERRRMRDRKAAAAAAEAHAKVLALAQERRRAREEQLAAETAAQERTRGVSYEATLTAVPYPKANTNRIALPPSALEALEAQRAIDVVSGPLTFEVAIVVPGVGAVRTHCGVDAFTAEEGTCGVPPSVALSLARPEAGLGVDALAGRALTVRFMPLPRFDEVTVSLQPRGQGFHVDDAHVVNIDLETVLQRTLRDVLTLSEGDVVPVRHEHATYELVVKSIRPEPAVLILNTDVAVDILPSERAEQQAAQRQRRADWLVSRRQRIDALGSVTADAAAEWTLRLRTPDGKAHTGAFSKSATLGALLDWALVRMPEAPETLPMRESDRAGFDIVRGRRDRLGVASQDMTLEEAGIADRDALLASWNLVPDDDDEQQQEQQRSAGDETGLPSVEASAEPSFSDAQRTAEAALDVSLEDEQLRRAMQESQREHEQSSPPVDKVSVFNDLVSGGLAPQDAAGAAQQFAPQLLELRGMGFDDTARCVELLRRYQGRLERVVNVLAGGD